MADFRVPKGQSEKPRYTRKAGAKPREKVIQVRMPISGAPGSTDVDLWGGGPEGDRLLAVALADPSIAKVDERKSPGPHLRRFRISPKRAGKTVLAGKVQAGNVWAKTDVLIHNFKRGLKFKKLWDAYPTSRIGGDCGHHKDQCACRVSAAMTKAGMPISSDYTDPICKANGVTYARGARSLGHYLVRKLGSPEIYKNNEAYRKRQVQGRRGIILFASYHIDVWDGTSCKSGCYFYKPEIWFWELE